MTSRNIIQALPHLDNAPVYPQVVTAIHPGHAIDRLAVNVFNSRAGHAPFLWLAGGNKDDSYKDQVFHITNIN